MCLIVSFLSPHHLHLWFCCVLSILALIWLVLMALFWASIRNHSVSLLRLPFLSQVQVFSYAMSLVSLLKRSQSCFSYHLSFWLFSFPGPRVVSNVSDGCNQSFPALFYVVFESLYRCVIAGKSSSSPLSWHNLSTSSQVCSILCMIISFLVFWPACLRFSLVHYKNGSMYLIRAQPRYLSLW